MCELIFNSFFRVPYYRKAYDLQEFAFIELKLCLQNEMNKLKTNEK